MYKFYRVRQKETVSKKRVRSFGCRPIIYIQAAFVQSFSGAEFNVYLFFFFFTPEKNRRDPKKKKRGNPCEMYEKIPIALHWMNQSMGSDMYIIRVQTRSEGARLCQGIT